MMEDEATGTMMRWQQSPLLFIEEAIDGAERFIPEEWQCDVLAAVADPRKRRIALQAAKGPGKTALLAVIILWFLATQGRRGSPPKGFAASINLDNLKMNLWPEIQKWSNNSSFMREYFVVTNDSVAAKNEEKTRFFSARTWARDATAEQQANTLAGLHGSHTLIILDESAGMPTAVMAAAEGSMTGGEWNKIIQAGNPTHRSGPLYAAATRNRDMWSLFVVTGDPDDPKRSKRISLEYCHEQIALYGKDDPWVRCNVFNEFPEQGISSLFSINDLEAAVKRSAMPESYMYAQRRIGVDVARFGSDKTVLFPRQGLVAFKPAILRKADTLVVASRIADAKQRFQSESEFIDDTGGFGGGVIDLLRSTGHAPIGVNFSSKADDARYYNKRAEMWFRMRDWVASGACCIPNNSDLIKQLTEIQYSYKNGKIILESKEQLVKRLQVSPDEADALALTFCFPEMPSGSSDEIMLARLNRSRRVVDDRPEQRGLVFTEDETMGSHQLDEVIRW